MSEQNKIIDSARRYAQTCNYEKEHSEQVTGLALRLFDLLAPLHGLSDDRKWLLTAAGLLHDIGWADGQSKHHKTSMNMILSDTTMPLEQTDRNLIALIARYHRKALPNDSHPIYNLLPAEQKRIVAVLGGILRLVDGLDRSHTSAVQHLAVETGTDYIHILCSGSTSVGDEIVYGQKKADLLELCLSRKIRVLEVGK